MKLTRILLAAAVLLVPLAARTLWFYQGIYTPAQPILTPDYESLQPPQAPLSTPIPPRPASDSAAERPQANLLVDFTHGNWVSLKELEALTQPFEALGGRTVLSTDPYTFAEQLKNADAYLSAAATMPFTAQEAQLLSSFVQRGGRLAVICDPTRSYASSPTTDPMLDLSSCTASANLLLQPFDLAFADDYLYNLEENDGNFRHLILTDIQDSPLTQGVQQVIFYAAHSLKSSPQPLLRTSPTTRSSLTDAPDQSVVASLDSSGQVLAVGDLSFLQAPNHLMADNQQWIAGIAGFLAGGQRQRTLAEYPYIFQRPVTLLVPANQTLKQGFITILGAAQRQLALLNLPLTTAAQPVEGSDTLIFGLYQNYEQLAPYLAAFDLEINLQSGGGILPPGLTSTPTEEAAPPAGTDITPTPSPELSLEDLLDSLGSSSANANADTVTIPGLGSVETASIGLVLYQTQPSGNTLILLAATEEGLSELANLLTSQGLSTCAVQDNVAVCPLSSSSSFGQG